MFYRVGLPFWKTFARKFGKARFRVEVMYDKEAKVFVARSPDLNGFVVEAATVDELLREGNNVATMLLEECLKDEVTQADPIYKNLGTAIANA